VLSRSGTTADIVAAARPAAPVIAVTMDAGTCRRMNMLWGVVPVQVEASDLQDPGALARRLALDSGLASPGQFILTVAGFANEITESTPTVTVLTV
jgi:pyruvate kinase